jgi:hypothetical protein
MSHWRFAQRSLKFYSFADQGPRWWTAQEPCSDELDWAEHARIGTLRWLANNLDLNWGFPQHNFINGHMVCSSHGDRGHGGQMNAFSMIGEFSVQFGGSASITELWECSNEGEGRMNWPELYWPWWGWFHGGGNLIWGKNKIQALWRTIASDFRWLGGWWPCRAGGGFNL